MDDILELTSEMIVEPSAAEWKRANTLNEHPKKCRCFSCTFIADLAMRIRLYDAARAKEI
jgi:hypothetical protein